MAAEESDGDRHHHRRHTESHRRYESHGQPDPVAPFEDEFSKPSNPAALREARLKSMSTPASSRKKMKIEYEYSRPAKTATVKKTSVASSGLFGRRSTVKSTRSKSATALERKNSGDRVYQYVYKSQSGLDEPEPVEETEQEPKRSKPALERRKTVTDKHKVERRKTEPVAVRRSSTTASRPHVKKSNTSVKDFAYKLSTDAEKSTAPRRTSVFGTLFAKTPPVPEKLVSCLTCGSDDIPTSNSAKLPCTHRMCHSCLKRIFKMSVKDPAHMPPRCCTAMQVVTQLAQPTCMLPVDLTARLHLF